MSNIENDKDLGQRIKDLHAYLEIEKKEIEILNDEEKAASPGFWDNPKEAEEHMKSLRSKKKWVEEYNQIVEAYNDYKVLAEFIEKGEGSEEDVKQQHENTKHLLEHGDVTSIQ